MKRQQPIKQRRVLAGQQVLALPGIKIPQVGEELLWCADCQTYLPADRFHNPGTSYCIEHTRARSRANLSKYRHLHRAGHLRRAYGLSPEQYDTMFAAQDGKCAVCGQVETKIDPRTKELKWLCVDHDHETGAIRGLLCGECNISLGNLHEDPARILALLRYAERIRQDQAA